MEELLNFAFSFFAGISQIILWLNTKVDLGSFGEWTILSLLTGSGLVALLGYKFLKFWLPTG